MDNHFPTPLKNSLQTQSKSLQSESPIDALNQKQDDWLPTDQPAEPIQKLAIHHVRLFPRSWKHSLEIHLLVAVWTGLLLADNAPSSDAELMELVATGQSVGVLDHSVLPSSYQQFVGAHSTCILFQMPFWHSLLLVVANVGCHFLSADLCEIPGHNPVI